MKPLIGASLLSLVAVTAQAQTFHTGDGSIIGDLCVGNVCSNTEVFVDTPLRLKSARINLSFEDTSSATFPSTDWNIKINDNAILAAGGKNHFTIQDVTAGTDIFRLDGGAPSSSFYMASGGDIGLGTTLPLERLHIVDSNTPQIRFEKVNINPYSWDIGGNSSQFFVQDVTVGTNPLVIEDAAPSFALNIESNGDIGLGTDTPEQKLHIKTSANNTDAFALFDAAGTGSDAAFLLRQQGTVPTTWEFRNQQSSGRLNIGVVGGNTIIKVDDLANNNLLKIGLNGQPDAVLVTGRLLVNNTQLSVPDYVFSADYALRPLNKLRDFITANSHLPEVPSATDIARDGVDMTEMQMTLLKKVEELTLYTLEQDDVIENLLARLTVLEDQT
jgi:hypothetical protein